jgi:hypothetical protein
VALEPSQSAKEGGGVMTETETSPPTPAGDDLSVSETEAPFENEAHIGAIPVLDPNSEADGGGSVIGGTVLPHVEGFAAAMCAAKGACDISTYEDHDPEMARAIDILVSSAYGRMPADFSFGDDVAAFTFDEWVSRGVLYIIWRQRINHNDGRGWRAMDDRGTITQNHFDHCHVSFKESGDTDVVPEEDFLMSLTPKEQKDLLDKVKNTELTLARLETILADPQSGIAVRLARLDDKVKELSKRLPG